MTDSPSFPPAGAAHSPAAERNRVPLLAALQRLLLPAGLMLEIASGTGQHAAHCAAGLPGWQWQPSEADARLLPSIAAWCAGVPAVRPPLVIDVLASNWANAPAPVDAVFCANMLHIAPWAAAVGLVQGAARHLGPAGLLLVYGPFLEDDVATAGRHRMPGCWQRSRHPAWGLRRLAEVDALAQAAGLRRRERIAMPANNLMLAYGRVGLR